MHLPLTRPAGGYPSWVERRTCMVALVSETRHGLNELCRNGIYLDHECLPWRNGLRSCG